jgi:hypothetical protein
MSNLVKSLKWNYVATINEEGNTGGIDAFIANAKNESIILFFFALAFKILFFIIIFFNEKTYFN